MGITSHTVLDDDGLMMVMIGYVGVSWLYGALCVGFLLCIVRLLDEV